MIRAELEASLEGRTSINLGQLAKDNFTSDFLRDHAGGLVQASRMIEGLGMPVTYNPTELDKCVAHYTARKLIGDLWSFSVPSFKKFV
ncbi:MAG TPA: hypothetical protein VM077_00640 [Candidatus Limnocylindrales bacterium]|nr:hypothetical protein [Candidatus Limnocylindrales bacterium]